MKPPTREESDRLRDQGNLSTLNEDGSRKWIKPRPSYGRTHGARRTVAFLLIALFASLPWFRMGGKPVFLLDIAHREFTILGTTYFATDTLLLALSMVTIFVTVFIVTAVLGRVWCGWACPQTVYLEFVFRPLERFFDGAPGRSGQTIFKKLGISGPAKFVTYLVLSFCLANTFLAYFVGTDNLIHWITRPPTQHPVGFTLVVFVTGLMLFDFGYFREQLCIVACPYGRFQSVLLDVNSLIVGYDARRGEPRGRASKVSVSLPVLDSAPKNGDCVDCGLCVSTCPTGIDIRNGLQLECVHCAQCIDACNAVMAKLDRRPGLIRYGTQAEFSGGKRRFFRPRLVWYGTILAVLLTL
ncbi:MAG: cytochrome c oxidase accessory protein CcoG, partial [Phycisphaerales bacterium]